MIALFRCSLFWLWLLAIVLGLSACDRKGESPAENGASSETKAGGLGIDEEPPPPPEPEFKLDTTSKVAILGYHAFTMERGQVRDMTIHADDFRLQMQTLEDNKIPVIPMSDFLAWRRGEKNLPPFSVVITADDGWISVYDLAFPILKEKGYPFTVYLYTNFFNTGGRALKIDQVKEMMAYGCEVGSHSISHADLRNRRGKSDEAYAAYLKSEMEESRAHLKGILGVEVPTFAYPYGAYNEGVVAAGVQAGYEAMVTVQGKKVDWDANLNELSRYIVHGDNDQMFRWAISTHASGGLASGNNLLSESVEDEETGEAAPLVTLSPPNGELIVDRRPVISADLSNLEGIQPSTIAMKVSGLGEVIPVYDPEKKTVSYTPHQRLRLPEYWVQITLKRDGEKQADVLRWKFLVDAVANYMPTNWEPSTDDASADLEEDENADTEAPEESVSEGTDSGASTN